MAFLSESQREYFNKNKARLEAKGVNVDKWNKASEGLKLPKRVKKKKPIKKKRSGIELLKKALS